MKKLLIIDSNSILNRAFYGIRYLSAKDGTPTNAVYGYLNILMKLIEEQKPDYLCAAFDLKAPTFRHKQFAEYKAQRKPMPEGLAAQMPLARQLVRAMNIPLLEIEGYEADDIIGTVARLCEEQEVSCMIATGDKDDLQLATDKTKVILTVTRSGVNETVIYDAEAVYEKYHVTPSEFIDVKALMGDPSDNIPGVKGVGEKTALQLIEQHKSIEYIYEHIDEIGLKNAMLQKMKDGREMAFLSKQLATIDCHAPVEFSMEDCAFRGIGEDAGAELYPLLKRLGLNSIIKRLQLEPPEDGAAEEAPAVDIYKDAVMKTVTDPAELSGFLGEIKEKMSCIFWFDGQTLAGAALSYDGQAVYVPVQAGFTAEELTALLKPVLENPKIQKFTFDIKDSLVRLSGTIAFENLAYDAAIAAYLVDPAKSSYTIDALAQEYLGVALPVEETKQMSLFEEEQPDVTEKYCKQVLAIAPLAEVLEQKIKENGQDQLYHEVELPLVEVLAGMQYLGFKVDSGQLSEFSDMLNGRLDGITRQIFELAGEEFNINSPKQLGVILFEKLGLKAVKKTKTGYSTNVEVLEKLKGEHPIISLLMEYRQLAKLKSTYCDGLAAVISEKTGRIHSVFTQTVTVTGRISSTEPNMQNIPTRTELGREIRKMFVAEEGYVLVDADYSQIELRVLAHIAEDETMINAFLSGEDIHAVTASQVFDVPLGEVTRQQRSSAKAVNFGIVYGIGEFSLAQNLEIPIAEAKRYIKNYLSKYHGVREYMERIKQQAKEDGYVKTMLNRIRYIPELKSSNFNVRSFGERVALNTPIQGTAADIIKLAMVRVYRRLKQEKLRSRLILQVHDELIVEAWKEEVPEVKKILQEEMEHALTLRVPLQIDMSEGHRWYDAK